MIRMPCTTCGTVDYPKFRRRYNRNGKIINVLSGCCVLCKREEYKLTYEKIKLSPSRYSKRLTHYKKWYEKNKDKRKEYMRAYELKRKHVYCEDV